MEIVRLVTNLINGCTEIIAAQNLDFPRVRHKRHQDQIGRFE